MKLEEAVAIYVPKDSGPRFHSNQRIKAALKEELQARAVDHLATSWEQIVYRYSAEYRFEGSPEEGTAAIVLRKSLAGGPKSLKAHVKLSFKQRELLED